MWRRSFFPLITQATLHLFLPTREHFELQLQAIDDSLLLDQHIAQGLQGIVLERQTGFQICNTGLCIHHHSPDLS